MGINWVTALQGKTVEDVWKYFSTELKSAMDAHIPKSCPTKDTKRKIGMNRAAIAMAWKRYTETGDSIDYVRATQDKKLTKRDDKELMC